MSKNTLLYAIIAGIIAALGVAITQISDEVLSTADDLAIVYAGLVAFSAAYFIPSAYANKNQVEPAPVEEPDVTPEP